MYGAEEETTASAAKGETERHKNSKKKGDGEVKKSTITKGSTVRVRES